MVENKFAGPIAVGAGEVVIKAVAAGHYLTSPKIATPAELAAAIVAARFGISPCMARTICELAGLGNVREAA